MNPKKEKKSTLMAHKIIGRSPRPPPCPGNSSHPDFEGWVVLCHPLDVSSLLLIIARPLRKSSVDPLAIKGGIDRRVRSRGGRVESKACGPLERNAFFRKDSTVETLLAIGPSGDRFVLPAQRFPIRKGFLPRKCICLLLTANWLMIRGT